MSFTAAFKSSSGTYSKSHITATPTRSASKGRCPSHLTYSQIVQQDATITAPAREGPDALSSWQVLQTETIVSGPGEAYLHSKERIFFRCDLAQNALYFIDYVSFHRKELNTREKSTLKENGPQETTCLSI